MDSDHTVHYQEDWATEPDMRERVVSEGFTRLLSVIEASEGPRLAVSTMSRRYAPQPGNLKPTTSSGADSWTFAGPV